MRAAALLLLLACNPAPERQSSLADCPPRLQFDFADRVLIEPGAQRLHIDFAAARRCRDGSSFTAESVFAEVFTESGADVLRSMEVSLDAGVQASVELRLEVPLTANRISVAVRVEPTIGVIRQTLLVVSPREPAFMQVGPRECAWVTPFAPGRTLCVTPSSAGLIEADAGLWLDSARTVAITPAALWHFASTSVVMTPTDGGALARWPLALESTTIATRGDRVFIAGAAGVAEVAAGGATSFVAFTVDGGSNFVAPLGLRVVGDELLVARSERIDRFPLSRLLGGSIDLPRTTESVEVHGSTAGLWRVRQVQVELQTDDRTLVATLPPLVEPPRTDGLPGLSTAPVGTTDSTPLRPIGRTVAGRRVWAHPVEELDAGVLEVQLLFAPEGSDLVWADSQQIFAHDSERLLAAPRR